MYERELEIAVATAHQAGAAVKHWYDGTVTVREKANNSPLTEADIEANQIIQAAISAAFPDDGWLSEENIDSAERLGRQRAWIVDPLDGTQEFVNRIPEFVVCIGLADRGEAVVGVEYNPVTEQLFAGAKGLGLTLNGVRAHTTDLANLKQARVLASRSETKRGEWDEFRSAMDVQLTGSVAFKLGLIAAGLADATFSLTPKNEWDVCAGAALIVAGGGHMTDRFAKPLRFNQRNTKLPGLIACGPNLFEPIVQLLQRHGKMG